MNAPKPCACTVQCDLHDAAEELYRAVRAVRLVLAIHEHTTGGVLDPKAAIQLRAALAKAGG